MLLSIQDLSVELTTKQGVHPVLQNISLSLKEKEILSIVGESGCGKSMFALSIMGLLPKGVAKIKAGAINFENQDLNALNEKQWRNIRGNKISMIFQEPMTSLNPLFKVGDQISEVILLHKQTDKATAWDNAVLMLDKVGIPNPKSRAHYYPHQLSGGQKQRVMIAIALACNPRILIADEPTTALDVTVQAQIFDVLKDLQDELDTAIILITHDIGVVAEMTKKTAVFYAGRLIEFGLTESILTKPKHPYTQGLIQAAPHIDKNPSKTRSQLKIIPGMVPSLDQLQSDQCIFKPRCSYATDQCTRAPELITIDQEHASACWEHEKLN